MAVRIESQAEPIPGYKLIERIGGGGFGEVWKAEGPGGLLKAIKFVFGDMQSSTDEDGSRAEQEFKALNRVKSVHHPYILSLERYDVIDGQLIIVMELADRTLWDRYRECRNQGLPGIPREELLGYMQETAEALDLMNNHYQLQHLDIKPQNLFLVFNHIKVADFGLVKDIEGRAATVTGGVTPVYAAPETFDGWLSRFSDQYSLAIVYQELLTGQRPFTGTTIRQLVLQHLQGAPDLSSLLLAERPVIARALSKNPEHRFPTCLEFVQTLRNAVLATGAAAPPAVTDAVPLPSAPASKGAGHSVAMEVTRNARGLSAKPKPSETDEPVAEVVSPMAPLPPRPPKDGKAKEPPAQHGQNQTAQILGQDAGAKTEGINRAPELSEPLAGWDGVLRPALVVGLGRSGLGILKQLRKELNDQFGHLDALPHLRLLFLDTDPESIQRATQGRGEGLHPSEVLLTRLHRPSHYLRARDGKLPYESWLNSKILYRIPRQRDQACVRALGRLAFVDNHRIIVRRLEAALAACCAPECLQLAAQRTGLGQRTLAPRIYIATSLAGGTGSGMFLDLAYVIRSLLCEQGYDNAELVGLFLVPPAAKDPVRSLALANTFAALTELNHFAAADAVFTARYDSRDPQPAGKPFQQTGPPFQHCLLLPLSEARLGAAKPDLNEPLTRAGHYLFCDLLTPVGASADDLRQPQAPDQRGAGQLSYHTFGLYRMVWPRRQLLNHSASRLGARLVQHWMSKDGRTVKDEIHNWALEQWEAQGFRPENLIARHQEKCQQILKQAPEQMFQNVIGPLADLLAGGKDAEPAVKIAPVIEAVDNLEKLVGVPEECRPQSAGLGGVSVELAPVEKALRDVADQVAGDCEQKLAELIVRLFEEPPYRLAGAEEAVRAFSACVQQALENQEPLLHELQERTVAIHQRLHGLLDTPPPATPTATTPRWKSPFTRRMTQGNTQATAELLDLIRSFAKCRYQSLVLQTINGLYVRLRGDLSDHMREIGFCRHRLKELADLVQGRCVKAESGPGADQVLLPQGCADLEAFARQFEAEWTSEDILAFDQQIQALIKKQFRALVQVCMASSDVIRILGPLVLQEAEAFLQPRLEGANVAEMLLARYPEGDEGRARLEDDLLAAYDEAAPTWAPASAEGEACIIAVPAGEAGDRLRRLAQRLFPNANLVTCDRADEILFVRGFQPIDLAELEQLGPAAHEAYLQRNAQDPHSIHSRGDITDWRPAVAVH